MHPDCYQLYGVKKEKEGKKRGEITILFSNISLKSNFCLKILIDIHECIIY